MSLYTLHRSRNVHSNPKKKENLNLTSRQSLRPYRSEAAFKNFKLDIDEDRTKNYIIYVAQNFLYLSP